MPLTPIVIPPGIVRGQTAYDARGRWVNGNRVRFVDGRPEKVGGSAKVIAATLTGVCRGIHGWRDGDGNRRLALGTHKKLQTLYSGVLYDLTPVVASGTYANNPLTTANGTAVVSVLHVAHGRLAGDYVIISGSAAVGGITPNGEFVVATVTDADHFTYVFTSNATSTATGGGAAVAYSYLLATGLVDDGESGGYGAGGYGLGGYGVGIAAGVPVYARTWMLDNYGEDLIATPRSGGIYSWSPPVGTPSTRAAALAGAPTACAGAFVTDERIVFAYGVTTVAAGSGFTGSKMLAQWCSDTNNTDWTPSTSNTAGGRTLAGGNELLGHAKVTRGIYLVFSDTSAFIFQYSGDDYVFQSRRLSEAAGIIGPKAAGVLNSAAFWVSRSDLMMYDGALRVIPNSADIWSEIFKDINLSQRNKVHVGINEKFGEVWFFWCSANSSEVDRYAIVNTKDWSWSVGSWQRTAWFPRDIFEGPQAADASGYLRYHESGMDDDGAAMGDYIESSPGDLQEGEFNLDMDTIIPDLKDVQGTIAYTVLTKDKPQDDATSNGPYNVTSTTADIDPDPRINGRQVGLKIASTSTGSHWRLGRSRVNIEPAGTRP